MAKTEFQKRLKIFSAEKRKDLIIQREDVLDKQKRVQKLLDEFYKNRKIPFDRRLTIINSDLPHPFGIFFIQNFGSIYFKFHLTFKQQQQKVLPYRQEFIAFGKFLKNKTKKNQWEEVETEVKKIEDIDKNIKDVVTALNTNGLITCLSCEGHLENGTLPFVNFNSPVPKFAKKCKKAFRKIWMEMQKKQEKSRKQLG